ncbi:glucose 1-dehydrogenase/3-oxoacyl-[acyl-carrier protein] reductase [Rhizobium sp. BK650]|uniref:SDR family NAD(P)-dependent oxidoreductase n=1 Tax=Rhizobium sp. BK650 TaxID=2586990 RepID=UPI001609BD3C|nr:glucose 1-dehydrogenase [Rhizobium sp. BK650]MBB3660989.1 glucose 1-dehydrogenase/3-oxoacyl-[acyl-carrier protein] reductase [Rhizobium sp. BK650]
MTKLLGKKAIVTGGGSGIGRAIAEALVVAGADVLITVKSDVESAKVFCELAASQGRTANFMTLSCEDPAAPVELFSRASTLFQQVDILVNNAAFATRTSFIAIKNEEYDLTQAVNARFPFFAIQQFARTNIERGTGGSIINVASVSGYKSTSRMSAYQSSKAALLMLTKSAALELAPYGIRVNALSPGLTATKGNAAQWRDNPEAWAERSKGLPLGRTGKPEDMAGAAVFLASDESGWMTGGNIVIDGGSSVT